MKNFSTIICLTFTLYIFGCSTIESENNLDPIEGDIIFSFTYDSTNIIPDHSGFVSVVFIGQLEGFDCRFSAAGPKQYLPFHFMKKCKSGILFDQAVNFWNCRLIGTGKIGSDRVTISGRWRIQVFGKYTSNGSCTICIGCDLCPRHVMAKLQIFGIRR